MAGFFFFPPVATRVFLHDSLASLFIEAYGTGLKKIMSAYPVSAPEKLLQTTDKVFKVTLPRLTVVPRQTGNHKETHEEKVFSFLASAGFIARVGVEQLTGLSAASAARLLRRLADEGELKVMGGGKAARYFRKYPNV